MFAQYNLGKPLLLYLGSLMSELCQQGKSCKTHRQAFYINICFLLLIVGAILYVFIFSREYIIALALLQSIEPSILVATTSNPHEIEQIFSIHELWSSQASLYQIIITLLIFVNSIFGFLCYLYISRSSEDKIYEAAVRHMETAPFGALIREHTNKIINDEMSAINEQELDRYERTEKLERKMDDLQKKMALLTDKIANEDKEEEEGFESKICKG